MSALQAIQVPAGDGRVLDGRHSDVGGRPVVVLHGGTPSGVAEWPQLEALVEQAGLGLVTYARPGYAESTRREGRTVASAADDTRAVLDHLGVDAVVSLGISGGGPHSLADAAGLGDRCRGAVVVSGLAPMDAPGLDFFEGMGAANQAQFRTARDDPAAVATSAEQLRAMTASLDAAMVKATAPHTLPPVDAAVMASPLGDELAEYLAGTLRSAFSHGVHGLVDDHLSFAQPWGFDVSAVAGPVTVWHGTADESVPVSHGRWIVEHVSDAEGRFLHGHGHVSILAELPAVIDGVASLAMP